MIEIKIERRIRNQILEYLEGVVEYPRNRGQTDLNELVNEWETWVDDPFLSQNFPAPAFSANEVAALAITHDAWLAFANSSPKDIKDEPAALSLPEWKVFVGACSAAIKVFLGRGRFREDAETGP
jgi:hypothetical protein